MKCPKCKKDNNDNVNYCYKCGYKYEDKEKKLAQNKGFRGLVNNFKKFKGYFSFGFITGKIWFKSLIVVIILGVGILNVYNNGAKFRIIDNDNYTYEYNKQEKEYYLYTKGDEIPLSLYMMGDNGKITLEYYNSKDELISTKEYSKEDEIKVLSNTAEDNYYKVTYNKKDIKLRVYNN